MLVNKLGVDVLLLMLSRLRFCKSFQSDSYVYCDFNNSALDFLICSLSPGVWQSFVTIRSCNHLMRIISTYVDNTKKSEIS